MQCTTTAATADQASHILEMGELATSVIKLLNVAAKEVEKDKDAARTFIARASSLLQVAAERRTVPPEQNTQPGRLVAWQVVRVKAFVEEHLPETISVKQLSNVARLSAAHFSRVFKHSFGEAPHAYIIRRRLDRARHLMLSTDAPLCEVALACDSRTRHTSASHSAEAPA